MAVLLLGNNNTFDIYFSIVVGLVLSIGIVHCLAGWARVGVGKTLVVGVFTIHRLIFSQGHARAVVTVQQILGGG